ncbi:polysaccharide deacetylase family protein [Kutzneria kofuensis]|uniref:Peptidoglycan/xylan/chitin deacetylase (PgdA/CDA1 family) n=1 Tax=Kutzneria kofuensis TaxID=103725 RepID=A0A7W9KKB9_9PSEU|nr:polysaccharide deacetylase family protein [Kutzneria kofuensis]MBB5894163.1 peptidoglycan/xylan/chitin deacetylase (PgdA/CDA1 family) [Kutzneria kofuensis]
MAPDTTSSSPTPTSSTTTTIAAPPSVQQPYPFGQTQANAPAIVGGKAPVVRRIDTTKPYVFITIDDGAVRDPHALELIKQSGARPTLFLNERYVHGHEDYFKQLQDQDDLVIGNHTVSHPDLSKMSYAAQKKEICDDSDAFARAFGHRPTLFRPPFGNYNADTQRAAADCGLKAVILWTAAVNDGVVQFQAGNKLKPGDIVLMHFRKTFVQDYTAFINRARQDGLTPVPLPDFLA